MNAAFDEVRVLAPVWGRDHLRQFLDFGLASLLAPGNLPAVAVRHRCVFVLFTRARDKEWVQTDPVWLALSTICSARIEAIDDLISRSSSTVLTLAYLRGIRARGPDTTRTAFVFLVGDYLFADGALSFVVGRIASGIDGLLAGNVQITDEGARGVLVPYRRAGERLLAIPARDLVRISLAHLHPATLAAFADDPLRHDLSSNRLFWRAGSDAIVGRFYLMHMIAIRPEVSEFSISAPSDYGLIPTLCPSGRVEAVTDSDDYLVVEMQPKARPEPSFVAGPLGPAAFGRSLSQWATADHLANVRHRLRFHAGSSDGDLHDAEVRSDAFVADVVRDIAPTPNPVVDHPIWRRSLDIHLSTATSPQATAAAASILGIPGLGSTVGRARRMLIGRAPNPRPWHPRWADFELIRGHLRRLSAGKRVLVLADTPPAVTEALAAAARAGGASNVTLATLDRLSDDTPAQGAVFDLCLLLVETPSVLDASRLLRLRDTMEDDGMLLVSLGDSTTEAGRPIGPADLDIAGALAAAGLDVARVHAVSTGPIRELIQGGMMQNARAAMRGRSGDRWRLLPAATLAALSALCNWWASRLTEWPGRSRFSSVLIYVTQAGGR